MTVAAPPADRLTPVAVRPRHCAPGPGPRILLLHGMANGGTVWDRLIDHAPDQAGLRGAELWTAELPWRGGALPEWSQRTEASTWVGRTLDLLRRTAGPADLVVAHSYAATALLEHLCRQAERADGPDAPDLPRGLVLVSPFFRARPDDFDWGTVAGLADAFVATMEEGIRVAVAGGRRSRSGVHRAMAEKVCETIGPYGWLRFAELYLRTPWLRADLITTPVLLVSGTADAIAATADSASLADRLPMAAVSAIEGCGHFPMIERAAYFAGLIGDFAARAVRHPEPVPSFATGDSHLSNRSERD